MSGAGKRCPYCGGNWQADQQLLSKARAEVEREDWSRRAYLHREVERHRAVLHEIADALSTPRVGWITATLPREMPPALVKEFQVKLVALGDEARAALYPDEVAA